MVEFPQYTPPPDIGKTPSNVLSKVLLFFADKIGKIFKLRVDHTTSLRIQEHMVHEGSSMIRQMAKFRQILNQKGGNYKEFATLLQNCLFTDNPFFTKSNHHDITDHISHLKVGKTQLIDSGTKTHAMLIAVTKTGEDSYTFKFCNTGGGVGHHPDIIAENGKQLFQTVLEWEEVPGKAIGKDFWKKCIEARNKDVDAVYECLEESLGALVDKNRKDYPQYWSRTQLGGSCVPSSIWRLMGTFLTREELKEVKTDMRLRELTREYRYVKYGFDSREKTKVLLLDQVQKLKNIYGEKTPERLKKIEQKLRSQLAIPKTSDADIAPRAGKQRKVKWLEERSVKFYRLERSLKVFATLNRVESPFPLQLAVDKKNSPMLTQDSDFGDLCHILYIAVGTGNRALSAEFAAICIEKLENPSFLKETDQKKLVHFAIKLLQLAKELSEFDNSRSGIAKQYALCRLAFFLKDRTNTILKEEDSKLLNDLYSDAEKIANKHTLLSVKKYLYENNCWVQLTSKLLQLQKPKDITTKAVVDSTKEYTVELTPRKNGILETKFTERPSAFTINTQKNEDLADITHFLYIAIAKGEKQKAEDLARLCLEKLRDSKFVEKTDKRKLAHFGLNLLDLAAKLSEYDTTEQARVQQRALVALSKTLIYKGKPLTSEEKVRINALKPTGQGIIKRYNRLTVSKASLEPETIWNTLCKLKTADSVSNL
jgi:hypothetical protein